MNREAQQAFNAIAVLLSTTFTAGKEPSTAYAEEDTTVLRLLSLHALVKSSGRVKMRDIQERGISSRLVALALCEGVLDAHIEPDS